MRGSSQPEHEPGAILPVYAQYESYPGDVILPKSFSTVFHRPPAYLLDSVSDHAHILPHDSNLITDTHPMIQICVIYEVEPVSLNNPE